MSSLSSVRHSREGPETGSKGCSVGGSSLPLDDVRLAVLKVTAVLGAPIMAHRSVGTDIQGTGGCNSCRCLNRSHSRAGGVAGIPVAALSRAQGHAAVRLL